MPCRDQRMPESVSDTGGTLRDGEEPARQVPTPLPHRLAGASNRRDPLALLEESNHGRVPDLIPIRHGRMLKSPFTFYRGAALIMAADLAGTPASGLRVQACGDCHLLNFGAFATPERRRDI